MHTVAHLCLVVAPVVLGVVEDKQSLHVLDATYRLIRQVSGLSSVDIVDLFHIPCHGTEEKQAIEAVRLATL